MALGSRRRLFMFTAITGTLYLLAICLYVLTIPEQELSTAVEFSDLNLQTERRKNAKQHIDVFKASYVTLIPPNLGDDVEGNGSNETNDMNNGDLYNKAFEKYSFNELASSRIGLERRIPDNRPQELVKLYIF